MKKLKITISDWLNARNNSEQLKEKLKVAMRANNACDDQNPQRGKPCAKAEAEMERKKAQGHWA